MALRQPKREAKELLAKRNLCFRREKRKKCQRATRIDFIFLFFHLAATLCIVATIYIKVLTSYYTIFFFVLFNSKRVNSYTRAIRNNHNLSRTRKFSSFLSLFLFLFITNANIQVWLREWLRIKVKINIAIKEAEKNVHL